MMCENSNAYCILQEEEIVSIFMPVWTIKLLFSSVTQ